MNRAIYLFFILLSAGMLVHTAQAHNHTWNAPVSPETSLSIDIPQGKAQMRPDDDSLKTREQIEAEIQQLKKRVSELEAILSELTSEDVQTELQKQIEEMETRISSLEKQLPNNGDDEWGDSGFDDEDEWDWNIGDDSTDFDAWNAEIGMDFFEKYPAAFQWPFPMETVFANSFLRYNRVEGVYVGIAHKQRLNWHSQKRIVSSFSLGYGFSSKKGRYSAGVYFPFYFDNQILEIGGEGHLFTDSKDQWTIDSDENSLMAFFAREDFMDYFQRGGFSAGASWYYHMQEEQTLRLAVRYIHDTYKSMGKETDWSVFGGDKKFRENPIMNGYLYDPMIDGNVNSVTISAGYSTTESDSRSIGWNVNASYEMAGNFANGDYEFNQFIFDARRYQPLGEHINFNARFRVGGSDGDLPYQRIFDLGGIGTLPGYRFKSMSGTHIGLLNTEIILRSSIAGSSDGWFQHFIDNFNLILMYDVGTVTLNEDFLYTMSGATINDPEEGTVFGGFSDLTDARWYSSFGIAVGDATGSYRIGIAWPLVGESKDPVLVLRLASPF